jgi:multiple sugar transport system permease protein
MPWALPSVVSGILFQRIFAPDNGLLNSILVNLHIIHRPEVWMASGWAIPLITLVHVWGVLPLIALILLAGLQGIPDDVYSASAVDGATPIRQFLHITLPLLRPALVVAITVGLIQGITIFDEIYVLNGTALNTASALIQVYNTAFVDADFAHGTAFAFLVAAATALFAVASLLISRRSSTA